MSPASRSKSKDKKTARETAKGSLKPSGHANTSGYNPLSRTFHTFDTAPTPSVSPMQTNSRFRTIDDSNDHNGNSSGTGAEYDSVSNNGSWSGESEDLKEKVSQPQNLRQESIPGADNYKREKIRQKNERKHQRQKERRAQELYERCNGYLMSRKLEALAQQLVSMGFSHERATMALILNEGRVEESVAWLFEVAEDEKQAGIDLGGGGGNLKIDISEELARITDMEIRYKSSKQEVERAVVSCEGDLQKAEEILKAQRPPGPPMPEETGDPSTAPGGRVPAIPIGQNVARELQTKATPSDTTQQKRGEKDFNYTKVPTTAGPTLDPGTRGTQTSLKKSPPKTEWAKPQQVPTAPEKRWPGSGPNNNSNPSVACSLASSSQLAASPPIKLEARLLTVSNDLKNLQPLPLKEPVTVLQRPQSMNPKQAPLSSISSSPPGPAAMGSNWYPNTTIGGVDKMKPKVIPPAITLSKSISPNGIGSNPFSNRTYHQSQQQQQPQPQQQFVPNHSFGSMDLPGPPVQVNGAGLWSSRAASSLGLFSGLGTGGSSGSSSPVGWSTGDSCLQLDYTSIDWSLDLGTLSTKPNGLWAGGSYSLHSNNRGLDSLTYGPGVKAAAMRPVLSSGGGLPVGVMASNEMGSGGSSWEWTSPFEERDIFSLPRQFVSSPSL